MSEEAEPGTSERPNEPPNTMSEEAERVTSERHGEQFAAPASPWQRLDPRMLLVHPIRTAGQFLFPLLIAFVGVSASRDNGPWWLVPIAVLGPVVFGVLLWVTTEYRLTDTQFQQRKGLLNKQQLTAPLDRVRSVDLEASLLHRILGLSKVKIGTGVDDTQITLDSLSVAQAEELRAVLLRRERAAGFETPTSSAPQPTGAGQGLPGFETPTSSAPQPALGGGPAQPAVDAPAQVLAQIDWSWLRFAPFSLTRLVVLGGAIGVFFQFRDQATFLDDQHLNAAWERFLSIALPIVVAILIVGAIVTWLVVSMGGYAIQWWNLLLQREMGNIRLTAGLFTTRSTTVEEKRIRGVRLDEPALLRLVGGAELSTYATGVGSGGTTKVLPPCPRKVAADVGHVLLDEQHGEDHAHALTTPVESHGPRARRRCHIREQWFTLFLVVVALAIHLTSWPGWVPGWVLIAVPAAQAVWGIVAAELEFQALGHALTPEHLVSRHGSYQRTREVLERDGIIGWVISQSYFQRRAGLATLTATTAAGPESIEIKDVPLTEALAVAHTATPTVLEPFM